MSGGYEMARPRELDRWARVLAVSNDGDAVTELKRLRQKLHYMALWALRVEASLRYAPDHDLLVLAREGAQDAINLWQRSPGATEVRGARERRWSVMAGLFATRRDLDAWAVAVGASNDFDAAGELHKLLGRLLDGQDRIRTTARSLSKAPNEDVRRSLATALGRLDLAVMAVDEALRGFAIHERG